MTFSLATCFTNTYIVQWRKRLLKLSAAKVSKETLVLYLKRNKRVFSLYIICLHLKVLRRGHMDKEGKFTKARVEIENRFAIYRLTSGFTSA